MLHEIEVEIRFPDQLPPNIQGTLRIAIENASMADAPATKLVESDIPHFAPTAGSYLRTSMVVRPEDMDTRAHYIVSAHLDRRGDGEMNSGDLISTQSHPVLTQGHPLNVVVPLTLIGD
jgi:hypothetical protein